MALKLHRLAEKIDSRSARLALPRRRRPYGYTRVAPGIWIGYRRTTGAGSWDLRIANGRGDYRHEKIGTADDFEDADGEHVFDFWQACERGRQMARGQSLSSPPATVADAVDVYRRDLLARGAAVANAGRIRKHLTPTLVAKPIALLTAHELASWRDGLLAAGIKAATVVRLCKATKAALNLAAKRDPRVLNRAAWRDGLSGLAENFATRNIQRLDDDQVRAVVAAAAAIDAAFGLYLEVAAVTGARLSQIARLTVANLQADNGAPRLLMPTSRKGRSRKPGKRPVPITAELAAKLQSNRLAEAPLLLRADGRPWQSSRSGDHQQLYREAARRAGVAGTAYALRHSSIIRSLLANVPIRIVAATHDTSVAMIEATYSSAVADFADAVARRGLLDTAQPTSDNIVNLPRRS